MIRGRAAWLLVAIAACDPDDECTTRLDCAEDHHCLAHPDGVHGECVPMQGYTPTPPLEIRAASPTRDLLVVVDDGPGTAELQRRLVAAMGATIDAAQSSRLRVRVAVTSSTVAGPHCDSRAYARSGRFAHTSCLDRLDDFIADDGTDERALCTDVCTRTTAELGLEGGRPWIAIEESSDADDVAQSLACLVPQGTSGCVRPAPLGAFVLATMRADLVGEEEYGFFRRHTAPEVVVATLGMDCTVTDAGQAVFDPAGARTLWPDPSAAVAPPAVCWRAGVTCEGAPPQFDDCVQADRDLDGAPTTRDLAVLVPYTWDLGSLSSVNVIGGVPIDGEVVYSTVGDSTFIAEHGIAPGCDDGSIRAAPPLRLDTLLPRTTSACAPTYDDTLAWAGGMEPWAACFEPCVATSTKVLSAADHSAPEVARCEGDGFEPSIPADEPTCALWVSDSPRCNRGRTELVVRSRAPGSADSVWLSPDPFAGSTPACAP